jgi:hypothetical protein
MSNADDQSTLAEERARRREAIGLSSQRPMAKTVVHAPPEAKRGVPLWPLTLLVLAILVAGWIFWQDSNAAQRRTAGGAFLAAPEERLIVRDDFIERHFALPVRSHDEYDLGYLGDLYQIRIERPGAMAWATLSQSNLGAYRLEADLRLAPQQEFASGYGGLIARYQNDDNLYLFVVDNQGNYQIQLVQEGAWRTVQPWTPTSALSDRPQNLLSVVDDGATLHFLINASPVDSVAAPQLPVGDVGLVVGARSQGKAKGLFDWVAIYETRLAE